MTDRLTLYPCGTSADVESNIELEIKQLGARVFPLPGANNAPLKSCIASVTNLGAVTLIAQRRVLDPDFGAEHSAYYSHQFGSVPRTCTRIHFFLCISTVGEDPLNFLDRVLQDSYLGFITLRPIPRAPVGATILAARVAFPHVVCSKDKFPVRIAGKHFEVDGTPFMQQDNAVAVCAQASIWMALRTLRRREGDRAHNPAQITDAATRYLISDRTRPNKGGLTIQQMAEAVRAAGYSPLLMRFPKGSTALTSTRKQLHAYVESDIPVLLALNAPSGGHAVAVVGHTWNATPAASEIIRVTHHASGINMSFCHAASWTPALLINNDNSGPYKVLPPPSTGSAYDLAQASCGISLLPIDVFMTGDEALACGIDVLGQLLAGLLKQNKLKYEIESISNSLVVRLLLADKSRLRQWAANVVMPPELSAWLRKHDLPRRVWVFEVHQKANFGAHAPHVQQQTLVGLVLIDPTGDALDADTNIIMSYFNFAVCAGVGGGMLIHGYPVTAVQTTNHGAIQPLERPR
ncbi:hypothetical protein [Xanthomonas campestris]|uniref:hypothetical protein n=1 Tax=Xanthomonas campestris TaxID=339 RepID=UPI002358AF37|nr:hypothetical protein [Xanthomonas campestris]MDC8744675.1 hypothetical protein [Xanthomonas campestris]MDM7688661.1 hypothetical protein [Xanthomonas campestris pv. campestris]